MKRYGLTGCGILLLSFVWIASCVSGLKVQVDRAKAAAALKQAEIEYKEIKVKVTGYCKAGRITKADCESAKELDKRLVKLHRELQEMIANPSKEMDVEKVIKYGKIFAALAAKVAI